MKVRGNNIRAIGKKFWRFVEVYIFVSISTFAGSAIVKDIVSAKSKSKDKTLKDDVELFVSLASAPPKAAPFENGRNERGVERAFVTVASFGASHRAVAKCAIEKGKEHFALAAQTFETRLFVLARQAQLQARAWRACPLNLLNQVAPLRI